MRARTVLTAALLSLAAAAPAAADEHDLVVDDVCGDAGGYVRAGETTQPTPATGREARYDQRGLVVSSPQPGRVRIQMTMCEAIGAPDGLRGHRGITVSTADGCTLDAFLTEDTLAGARRGVYQKTCYADERRNELGQPDERFSHDLPATAVTVAGATLTIDLDSAAFGGEAAAELRSGTVWPRVAGLSAQSTTVLGFGFGPPLHVDFAAPGAVDEARADRAFIVG